MHQTHSRSIKDYCLNLYATDLTSDTSVTMTEVEWPEVRDDVTAECVQWLILMTTCSLELNLQVLSLLICLLPANSSETHSQNWCSLLCLLSFSE